MWMLIAFLYYKILFGNLKICFEYETGTSHYENIVPPAALISIDRLLSTVYYFFSPSNYLHQKRGQ